MANVPLPCVIGVEGNNSFAVAECISDIDIEIFPVVDVPNSPAIIVVAEKHPLG